jgi:hypothetical protein
MLRCCRLGGAVFDSANSAGLPRCENPAWRSSVPLDRIGEVRHKLTNYLLLSGRCCRWRCRWLCWQRGWFWRTTATTTTTHTTAAAAATNRETTTNYVSPDITSSPSTATATAPRCNLEKFFTTEGVGGRQLSLSVLGAQEPPGAFGVRNGTGSLCCAGQSVTFVAFEGASGAKCRSVA